MRTGQNGYWEICAIPSMDGQLKNVGDRIIAEMNKLGYEEARFDQMGNVVGRIGNGRRVVVYDSHIDTVGVGDPSEWDWDPFVGKVEDGLFYARGACDEKGSTPGKVYGLAMARDLAVGETSASKALTDAAWEAGGDAVNDDLLGAWAALPMDEVRRRFRSTSGELRGYLTVVPETRWVKHPTHMEDFIAETLEHYEGHLADLRAILDAAR